IADWSRDTFSRLTSDPADEGKPVWTPDGRRITFYSMRANGPGIYWQRADGTGEVQRLLDLAQLPLALYVAPTSWHPSGKWLAFATTSSSSATDIYVLPVEGSEESGWKPGKQVAFQATAFNEFEPMFSPDGRWIAYTSTETGRPEVYVRPFPGPGGK